MNRFTHSSILLCFLLASGHAQNFTARVIPQPQDVTFFDATCQIDENTRLVLGEKATAADTSNANLLNETILELSGRRLAIQLESEVSDWRNTIYLGRLSRDARARQMATTLSVSSWVEIGQEGYVVQISDSSAILLANSTTGLFYGTQTLKQLLKQENGRLELPGVTIYDWPAMRFRGISLDLSKGEIPTLAALKETVRFLSRYKMNTFMLYLGNVLQADNHTKITEGRAFLTRKESAELVQFASAHHVEIIPMIETLSNLEEVLSLPEYRALAEFPGSHTLQPLDEDAIQLLNDQLLELSRAFPSRYVHLGGSAQHQVGWQASRDLVTRVGLSAVLASHYQRVAEIVTGLNKHLMMSGALLHAHPEIVRHLPDDWIMAEVCRPPVEPAVATASPPFLASRRIVSPILHDRGAIFPDYFRVTTHIRDEIERGARAGAVGAIAAHWSDPQRPTFQALNRYGIAYAAECSWSPRQTDIQGFNETFFAREFGLNRLALELVYNLLADIGEVMQWSDIWRHPYLPPDVDDQTLAETRHRLTVKLPLVLELLESISHENDAGIGHLDFLRFVARLGRWYTQKMTVVAKIEAASRDINLGRTGNSAGELTELCLQVVEDFNELIEAFQMLWARSYKIQDIRQKLDLFDVQFDYWQKIIAQLQLGRFYESPALQNDWIYHPALPRATGHTFFRKTFDVAPGFKSAFLQVAGESHAKIYLNGGFLGEVITDTHKRFRVDLAQVRMWNIGSALQAGKNVIALEVWNYRPGRDAGVNVYGELEYEFGRIEKIQTSSYWKTSVQEERNWQALGFFDVQWLNAEPRPRRAVLIQPDFKAGRASTIDGRD